VYGSYNRKEQRTVSVENYIVRTRYATLLIYDTPGQSKYSDLTRSFLGEMDAVIIVIDHKTAGTLPYWLSISPPAIPKILIVTKKDQAIQCAIDNRELPFFEVSAKEQFNLAIPFESIAETLRETTIAQSFELPAKLRALLESG
jgi:signal recognition particle receptor subunit beta